MDNEEEFTEDELMAYYMEIGAIELAGMDENGEFIFKITEEAAELVPELWAAHEEYLDRTLRELYDKGYVTVSYDEDLNATFEISEEGKALAKELGLIESDFDEDIPNE